MIKNRSFKKTIVSKLIFFIFNNVYMSKNHIERCKKKNGILIKIIYFESKKYFNNYTFYLNFSKHSSLNHFKKNVQINLIEST